MIQFELWDPEIVIQKRNMKYCCFLNTVMCNFILQADNAFVSQFDMFFVTGVLFILFIVSRKD